MLMSVSATALVMTTQHASTRLGVLIAVVKLGSMEMEQIVRVSRYN